MSQWISIRLTHSVTHEANKSWDACQGPPELSVGDMKMSKIPRNLPSQNFLSRAGVRRHTKIYTRDALIPDAVINAMGEEQHVRPECGR